MTQVARGRFTSLTHKTPLNAHFSNRRAAWKDASTAPKLIDAMSHDAAVLKQKKHRTPEKLHVLNALEVLSKRLRALHFACDAPSCRECLSHGESFRSLS